MRCALVLVATVLVVSTIGARVLDDKGDIFTSVKRVSTKLGAFISDQLASSQDLSLKRHADNFKVFFFLVVYMYVYMLVYM